MRALNDAQKDVVRLMVPFADEASIESMFPEERGGGVAALPPVDDSKMGPVKEMEKPEEEEKEEAEIDIDESIEKLKKISEAEDTAKEIKKSADEFIAQLEELKKMRETLNKFLADNAPKEEVVEEAAAVLPANDKK